MSRKNRSPEENARREKTRELLQMTNIGSMDDIQNLFKETVAELMENGLEAKLDDELGYSKYDYKSKEIDNRRKTLRTSFGNVEVSASRNRKWKFDPQVQKRTSLAAHCQRVAAAASEDHLRRCVLDAIHYHVHSEGEIVKKTVYIAIGVHLNGWKDVLSMWVGENESAKFWATVLNGLKNRGVEDIFITCTDNLTGFDADIHPPFPKPRSRTASSNSCAIPANMCPTRTRRHIWLI